MRVLWGVVMACGVLWAAEPHPVTPRDLFDLRSPGGLELSPDGTALVFPIRTQSLEANRGETSWVRLAASGGEPVAMVGLPQTASSVRWSPDGTRLAYISGKAIFVLETATGKSRRVCAYDRSNAYLARAGNVLAWSPGGRSLAFAGTLEPVPPVQDPVVITRNQYKSRTALADNRRTHIYVVDAAGGDPRLLTPGAFDEHSVSWAGEEEIVFLSNREKDPDAAHNYDIYAVHTVSGTVRQITKTPGVEMEPVVSPDGRWIAYTATKRSLTTIDSVAEDAHVWVIPTGGGAARELSAALDRRANDVFWSADSQTVYFHANDRGRGLVYRTAVAGGAPRPLFEADGAASSARVAKDGSLYFLYSDPAAPEEVYQLPAGAGKPRRLTHLNDGIISAWRLSRPEAVSFRSFDGTPVEGWLFPAVGAAGKVPLILSVHGGPHSAFGWSFQAAAQTYAGRGYAVLALNPRGSNGYGQKFSDGSVEDWGGGDYRDLMAGVDHVLGRHPEIDGSRMGVTGSSYGGYMTNWMITQTGRFRAAVASASLSNLISFYATSLYQDLVHAEFSGFPWEGENFTKLWDRSPLAHVKKAGTPVLLLHGEADNDVHITQAEEMYSALRRRGVETVLVRYPREGHGLSELRHRLDANERTLQWMDRFLRPEKSVTN